MMRRVKVLDAGDTDFILEEQVDRSRFEEVNQEVIKKGKKPAVAGPLILGITKASLSTESFISAASFQETTKVLTDASIAGKEDYLSGLKENVIMGRLMPLLAPVFLDIKEWISYRISRRKFIVQIILDPNNGLKMRPLETNLLQCLKKCFSVV